MNDFFAFAYEICWSLSPYQELPRHSRNWKNRCQGFVTTLAQEVEGEMARFGTQLASTLKLSTEQFNYLVNTVIEVLTEKPGRYDSAMPELGTCSFALEKMASVLMPNKEKMRAKVVEHLAKNPGSIEPDVAKDCLNKLVELSSHVVLADIVREMQAFAAARNSITHRRVKGEVSGASVLEGTFFGLRMLDRLSKLLDKVPPPEG
jgi:hypothetical protein